MKKNLSDIKYLIIIWCLFLPVFVIVWAHQGHLIIDCGREVFYPQRILEGSVLYKDLFNIYGPVSYLINAGLYKMFGASLYTLYFAGMTVSVGIVTFIYLISRLFFDKFLSFSISVLTLILGCFSFYIFNYIFPYSFAMSYGLLAFLASLYCLILFIKTQQNMLYYLSAFFAGLAVFSKYEFIPYLLIFLFVEYKLNLNWKRIITAILSCIIVPVLIFTILFLQGLGFGDIIHCAKDIIAMTRTQTLKFFYIISGLAFQKETLGLLIRNFFKSAFPIILFLSAMYLYDKSRLKSGLLFAGSFIAVCSFVTVEYFIFLPFLLTILAFIFLKKQTLEVQIFVLSSLLVSLKVFWATVTSSYGIFFIPTLIIAVFCFVPKDFRNKMGIYLLVLTLIFAINNLRQRKFKSIKVKTEKGVIYDNTEAKDVLPRLITYLKTNTTENDTVLILPEGLLINFLANRKSDDYYNSFLPLYIETFGEKRLINHFENNKPDFIIIHNYPTSDYYFKSICKDYAFEFCNFVRTNYRLNVTLGGDFRVYGFKKN